MLPHEFKHKHSNIQDRLILRLINLGTRQQFDKVSLKNSLAGKTEVNREIYTTVRIR